MRVSNGIEKNPAQRFHKDDTLTNLARRKFIQMPRRKADGGIGNESATISRPVLLQSEQNGNPFPPRLPRRKRPRCHAVGPTSGRLVADMLEQQPPVKLNSNLLGPFFPWFSTQAASNELKSKQPTCPIIPGEI